MSETNTARKSVTKQVAGIDRTFAFPNSYDKMELIEEYQRVRKAKLLETLNMADASAEQKIIELDKFDEDPPLDYVRFLQTPRGRVFALKLSLGRAYPNEADAILKQSDLSESDEFELIVELFDLKVTPKAPAGKVVNAPVNTSTYGDGGEPPPNPNSQTYGTVGEQNPTAPAVQ